MKHYALGWACNLNDVFIRFPYEKCKNLIKGGEIHFEPIKGEEFKDLKAKGKFSGIDFLETLFTGYQLYLYIHGKNDDFLARKKFPIYISNYYKQKMENLVNQGKTYC